MKTTAVNDGMKESERISIFMIMIVRYVFKFTFVHFALSPLLPPQSVCFCSPKDFRLRTKFYRNLMAFFSLDCHIFLSYFTTLSLLRTKSSNVTRNHDRCKNQPPAFISAACVVYYSLVRMTDIHLLSIGLYKLEGGFE